MDFLDDLKLDDLEVETLWPKLTLKQRDEERWRLARLCGALYALQKWNSRELSTADPIDETVPKRELLDT